MKLIALIVHKYRDVFEEQIFNFSDEFFIRLGVDEFGGVHFVIEKNKEFISNFYCEKIYNITPIVGINGVGKTSILKLLQNLSKLLNKESLENQKLTFIFQDGDSNFRFCSNEFSELSWYFTDDFTSMSYCGPYIGFESNDAPRSMDRMENDPQIISIIDSNSIRPDDIMSEKLDILFKVTELLEESKMIKSPLRIGLALHRIEGDSNRMDLFNDNIYDILQEYKDDLNLEFTDCDELDDILSNNYNIEVIKHISNFRKKVIDFERNNKISWDNQKADSIHLPSGLENLKEFLEEFIAFEKALLSTSEKYKERDQKKLFLDYYFEMSTGETNLLGLCCEIFRNNGRGNNYQVFLIDEIETGLHLEWSRQLIKFLVDFINEHSKHQVQLIFTTHSPYMLSDIKPGNVIALKKEKRSSLSEVYQNTFAKNIQEIMADDMFVKNVYGDFAIGKINDLIAKLSSDGGRFSDEPQKLKKEINLIAEPVLRNKLLDMYFKKYGERDKLAEFEQAFRDLTSEERRELREKLLIMEEN